MVVRIKILIQTNLIILNFSDFNKNKITLCIYYYAKLSILNQYEQLGRFIINFDVLKVLFIY